MEMNLDAARDVLGAVEAVPDAAAVRSVPIGVRLDHWNSRWPEALPRPEVLVSGATSLSRVDLFKAGAALRATESPTDAQVLDFYVRVCAWGTGTSAQSVSRVLRPLGEPDAVARMRASLQVEDPVESYRAFNNTGLSKVRYLGPAFFTKLMSFFRPEPLEGEPAKALILDARVAASLGASRKAGWRTDDYREYLAAVEELRVGPWKDVPADVVEYVLFEAKGDEARARHIGPNGYVPPK